MNPFLLPPAERLAEWRTFRNSLAGMEEDQQLTVVAEWFSNAPTNRFVLDFDNATGWPTPWEVMNDGNFCTTAIAYLMEQTLILIGWDIARLSLHYVRNQNIQDQMMILLVDNTWALNYSFKLVFNFDKERSDCAYLVSYRPKAEGGHTQI